MDREQHRTTACLTGYKLLQHHICVCSVLTQDDVGRELLIDIGAEFAKGWDDSIFWRKAWVLLQITDVVEH